MNNQPDIHAATARELLRTDAFELTERITGMPHHDERVRGIGLLLCRDIEERLRALLAERCDTYKHMPWSEFLDVAAGSGFNMVAYRVQYDFVEHEQTVYYAVNPERKMVLIAHSNSWSGEHRLDNATVYGTVDGSHDPALHTQTFYALLNCHTSAGPVGDTKLCYRFDARQGLRINLQRLDAAVLYTPWEPTPTDLFDPDIAALVENISGDVNSILA